MVSLLLWPRFTWSFGCTGAAERAARERRDHLVRVHVRARARAGLEDVDRELLEVPALRDLARRGRDGRGARRVELAELAVHLRGDLLDQAERAEEARGHAQAAEREVQHRALRLRAEQRVRRHLHLAQAVVLHATRSAHRSLLRREHHSPDARAPPVRRRACA